MKTYRINEIFYSLQGEGNRAGRASVFVRFSGCNLQCSRDGEAGFDCDTEFTSGVEMDLDEVLDRVAEVCGGKPAAVIFTGGEPTLQLDALLIGRLTREGYFLCLETNGTVELPMWGVGIDYIACSPKTAEHTLQLKWAHELRYVRNAGQGIPRPRIEAEHLFLSPAFNADGSLDEAALRHCIELCKAHPKWRLSVQQHKLWRVR